MAAKHIRGEVKITIEDEEYTLVPSFKAIAAIEAATGKGLVEVTVALNALSVTMITTVLHQALVASGYSGVKFDQIGEAVMNNFGDPDRPLNTAAADYLNAFFPKKQTDGKKPAKTAKTTAVG